MWIARVTVADTKIEKIEIKAPTLNSIYVKLFKILRMGVLEIHIYQEE